ncbi:MAG: hypothetical protein EA351_10530 [Gemmatimonadales bacterium]|nr:MAG: hypothetical protein EA351_10530 [Gemmatimonadales bacterium]
MIRPLELPVLSEGVQEAHRTVVRFTPAARKMLTAFAEAFGDPSAVLLVEASSDEELHLEFVSATTPLARGAFEVEGDPIPLRFDARTGGVLTGRTIDYTDEGGVRGFLVRTMAGPSGSRAPGPPSVSDGPLEAAIRSEIRQRVNPLVESHGGEVRLMRVTDEGVAEVEMDGGCQGCASARGTLEGVVRRILMRSLPELHDVIDVTDHDAGEAPFYSRDTARQACG